MVPLDTPTPAFSQADHSPLHVTSPAYIFNKVHDFQKGIKCDIMPYPLLRKMSNMIVGAMKLTQLPLSMVQKQSFILIIAPPKLHKLYYG